MIKKHIFLLFLFGWISLVGAFAYDDETKLDMVALVKTPPYVFKIGEDVVITVIIKNISSEIQTFKLPTNDRYQVDEVDEREPKVKDIRVFGYMISGDDTVTLEPGNIYTEEVHLQAPLLEHVEKLYSEEVYRKAPFAPSRSWITFRLGLNLQGEKQLIWSNPIRLDIGAFLFAVRIDLPQEPVQRGKSFIVHAHIKNLESEPVSFVAPEYGYGWGWKGDHPDLIVGRDDIAFGKSLKREKKITLKSGEIFDEDIPLKIKKDFVGESISFRLGFRPNSINKPMWSDPLTVSVQDGYLLAPQVQNGPTTT